jgi:uncharacterized protein (TIGR02172 family)
LKLNKPISFGRTAEVYDWNPKQVVKLFYKTWAREEVEYEYKVSNLVSDFGLQVPEVYEIVEIDGRIGIVFEKLEGKSMIQVMKAKPWQIGKFGKQLADLQYSFHLKSVSDLPKLKDNLERSIKKGDYITEEERGSILEKLRELPDKNQLCHNDFHPDNVLITNDGPYIIDWITVCQGDPLADFARTSLMLQIATPPTALIDRILTSFFRSRFYKRYSKRYFELVDVDKEKLTLWELPITAKRLLSDNISEERGQLLKIIRSHLSD